MGPNLMHRLLAALLLFLAVPALAQYTPPPDNHTAATPLLLLPRIGRFVDPVPKWEELVQRLEKTALRPGTFAVRPAANAMNPMGLYVVTDCTTNACTVGGGSTACLTQTNGVSTWTVLQCGGSGGSGATPGGTGTELQYRNGASFGAVAGSSWNGSTLTLSINMDVSGGRLRLPNGITLPTADCNGGAGQLARQFVKTDAAVDQQHYICTTSGWKLQGGAGTPGPTGAAGGAITIAYLFDTVIGNADPGNGTLRLNNLVQNVSTALYVDLLDSNGSTWTSVLDTFPASSSTVKGQLRLSTVGDPTSWLTFNVTSWTSHTGYRELALVNTGSSQASPFAFTDPVLLEFTRTGDLGATGPTGAIGATGATGPTGAGGSNVLLDGANHTDTVAASVVKGDLVYGNATPKWDRLAPNSTGTKKYLGEALGVPAWDSTIDLTAFGNGFVDATTDLWGGLCDDTNNFLKHAGGVWTCAPGTGGSSNALLDGGNHTDTTAGTVARGDLITGQTATPKWTRLAKGAANKCLVMDSGAVDVVWGTLAIGGGGTGQGTQTAGFDALAPTTTKGDLIVHNGTNNIRVAVGSLNQVLTADSGQPSGVKWAAAGGTSGATPILTFSTGGDIGSGGTIYANQSASFGTEIRAEIVMASTGTFNTFACYSSVLPGSGKTYTMTFRSGTCGSALADSSVGTCQINASQTCTASGSAQSVTALQCYDVKFVASSGAATGVVSCGIERAS